MKKHLNQGVTNFKKFDHLNYVGIQFNKFLCRTYACDLILIYLDERKIFFFCLNIFSDSRNSSAE